MNPPESNGSDLIDLEVSDTATLNTVTAKDVTVTSAAGVTGLKVLTESVGTNDETKLQIQGSELKSTKNATGSTFSLSVDNAAETSTEIATATGAGAMVLKNLSTLKVQNTSNVTKLLVGAANSKVSVNRENPDVELHVGGTAKVATLGINLVDGDIPHTKVECRGNGGVFHFQAETANRACYMDFSNTSCRALFGADGLGFTGSHPSNFSCGTWNQDANAHFNFYSAANRKMQIQSNGRIIMGAYNSAQTLTSISFWRRDNGQVGIGNFPVSGGNIGTETLIDENLVVWGRHKVRGTDKQLILVDSATGANNKQYYIESDAGALTIGEDTSTERLKINGASSTLTGDLEVSGALQHKIEFAEFKRTADQTLTTATWTKLAWQSESIAGDLYSLSSGDIQFSRAGYYDIEVYLTWDSNTTGIRCLAIGDSVDNYRVQDCNTAASVTTNHLRHIAKVAAANDTVEVRAYQNSGGNLNVLYTEIFLRVRFLGN